MTIHKSTAKKLAAQDQFIAAFAETPTIEAACKTAGIAKVTFEKWKVADPAFAQVYFELQKKKQAEIVRKRKVAKNQYGLLFDDQKEVPLKGTFEQWRRKYIGRAVEPHQRELVEAYEDKSNLVVFTLMPPGAGKDTCA